MDESRLQKYISNSEQANSHFSKAYFFLKLAEDLFGEDIEIGYAEDFFPKLEEYLVAEKGTIAVKGKADALLGNLIIEFKTTKLDPLRNEEIIENAKDQLRRYIYILWREHSEDLRYLLMASDGLRNFVYRPSLKGNLNDLEIEEDMTPKELDKKLRKIIELEPIDEIDISEADSDHVYVWLDRYLLYEETIPLTAENLSEHFGSGSPVYEQAIGILEDKWEEVKDRSEINLLFEQWSKYLEIVYGRSFGEDLFLRHTYLATLSKIMAYMFYSEGAIPGPSQMRNILTGKIFDRWGITGLIEKDFFSWPLRVGEEFVSKFCKKIVEHLSSFDLSELERDVLKEIYQELVDPQERHDLGEYYTPDWLADYMTNDSVSLEDDVLDPACGSGTFLVSSINMKKRELSRKGLEKGQILEEILDSVVGVDVHPIAVLTSKVNYLLALGGLIREKTGEIQIPVYHADTIRLPDFIEPIEGINRYEVEADGTLFRLPSKIVSDSSLTNITMQELRRKIKLGGKIRERLAGQLDKEEIEMVEEMGKKLVELDKNDRDSIWLYIIRNIYKPVFLKEKRFDTIIGNPPWLSYRYADSNYQDFLKPTIVEEYNLLEEGESELMTQLELATLFFVRASDFYLKEEGDINFVMPRGIFTSDQHDNFRKGSFDLDLGFEKIIDLSDVEPLFNVPSCVVKAKKGDKTEYPIQGEVFNGKLDSKNESWKSARKKLNHKNTRFYLNEAEERSFLGEKRLENYLSGSIYEKEFGQGATLVPRNFWFVDVKPHPKLGINPEKPYVETTEIKYAKGNYKNVEMSGNVDNRFLFATLRGSEIVPFYHLPFKVCVLPVKRGDLDFKMWDMNKARKRGYDGLANWLEEAEGLWKEKGGKERAETAVNWLNYRNKIVKQNPSASYKVLYLTSGKNIAACMLDCEDMELKTEANGKEIPLTGFVADYMTYYYETNNRDEALYLTSILNSPSVNEIIKGMQSRGLFGERHICKKVLELSIPRYNPSNRLHQKMAKLGEKCKEKARDVLPKWMEKYKGIAWIRKGIREDLQDELNKISEFSLEAMSEAEESRSKIEDWS